MCDDSDINAQPIGDRYYCDPSKMGKNFVPNRYVFNVPQRVFLGATPQFGGWFVPHDGNLLEHMWPLEVNESGMLTLVGLSRGYAGKQYDTIGEFDHFSKANGRRPRKVP